jgi:UDP-N-acetylglucosamine 2-epimerase (non-hydrolysing)
MVGHVEAGLRTGDKYNPYPEEINRHLIGVLADYHFAPTPVAKENLQREGVGSERIFVTGNTVIDTLKYLVDHNRTRADVFPDEIDFAGRRIVCVTIHRRESFGAPLRNTLTALKRIAAKHRDVEIVIPVHYNPNVRTEVHALLGGVARIHLIDPLPYEQFVHLLNKSYLILTDSGGIQEEAPSLGKPVLVLRETTERPEGIRAGTARLVGTDTDAIVSAASELLEDKRAYNKMARAANPYGDGQAAKHIVDILERNLANDRVARTAKERVG